MPPTVVVLEDAHWADEATLDLLRLLGRRIAGPGVFVLKVRDDELTGHPLRVLLGDMATGSSIGFRSSRYRARRSQLAGSSGVAAGSAPLPAATRSSSRRCSRRARGSRRPSATRSWRARRGCRPMTRGRSTPSGSFRRSRAMATQREVPAAVDRRRRMRDPGMLR